MRVGLLIDSLLRHGLDVFDYIRSRDYSYGEYRRLQSFQYLPMKELEHITTRNVRRITSHAYNHVPFYRRLFDESGVSIDKLYTLSDLEKMPIVSKRQLRENFPGKVVARGFEHRKFYDRTSGSTGEPFEFFKDVHANALRLSGYMLFNSWMGVGPNDKHVQIASPKPLTPMNMIRNRILRKYKISTLLVKRKTMPFIVNRINEIDPVYVEGYSASVDNFARLVEEMGLDLNIEPKAVIATSEDLVESHRSRIARVIGGVVYNRYGSREFSGAVAQECSLFEGLHVNSALCYVEIVDENGEEVSEGERGRIIVTDLTNYVMPFIRYDIGDTAVKGPREGGCGRSFPIIKEVRGKSEFFLVSKQSVRIPIETVASHLFQKYAQEVYNFQFVHPERGKMELIIVPTTLFREEIIKGMYEYLDDTLEDFDIEIRVVDNIPPTPLGKTPFLVTYSHER